MMMIKMMTMTIPQHWFYWPMVSPSSLLVLSLEEARKHMAEVQRRKEEEAKRKEEMRKANVMDFQGVWMVVYCVYTSPTSN